ncbi:hypothetical protein ACP70R_007679 [Stipagrostis hirtigluma subsp. patula]
MDRGFIGVDLVLDRPASAGDVLARFKFSILDHIGEPVPRPFGYLDDEIKAFSRKKQSWGDSLLISRNELELSYLKNDSFQIRCDITVIKELHAEDTTAGSLTVPPPDLHRHLGDLLASQVGGDVTFKVAGELFVAHRILLAARSSVFMAQLFSAMKEKMADCIQIDDMEPRVFKAMLQYMYTDLPPEVDEDDKVVMSQHLLVAADRYNIERLKMICEDMLRNCIDTNIAATTLVLAEQHGCRRLKEACFKFLSSPGNLKEVMASDGFQHLKSSCPYLLEELLNKVAP